MNHHQLPNFVVWNDYKTILNRVFKFGSIILENKFYMNIIDIITLFKDDIEYYILVTCNSIVYIILSYNKIE